MLPFILCVFLVCRFSLSQPILDLMKGDPQISQFYNLIQTNEAYKSYFNYEYICVFVPSNTAMISAGLTDSDQDSLIKRHVFKSQTGDAKPNKALVANWNLYQSYATKAETVYYVASLQGAPILLTSSQPLTANGATVVGPDKSAGSQVYHTVDRVFPAGSSADFLQALAADSKLSTSLRLWNKLITASNLNQLANVSNFRRGYLDTPGTFTGTVLVPSNTAWSLLPPSVLAGLDDPVQLNNVLARHYIPYRLVLARDTPVAFTTGFPANTKLDDASSIEGRYHREGLSDIVTVQGCTAGVLVPNIPFVVGLMHIVNASMAVPDSPASYLQSRAPSFYAEVSKDVDLAALLNGGNTVLAPDDKSMAVLVQLTPAKRKAMLLNCFIRGLVSLATLNGSVAETAGNTSVFVHGDGGFLLVDSVASAGDKTYYSRARVTKADQALPGANVNIISGVIGTELQSCGDVLLQLNLDAYKSQVEQLPISLERGSPYTLFAPSDTALSQLTNVPVATRGNGTFAGAVNSGPVSGNGSATLNASAPASSTSAPGSTSSPTSTAPNSQQYIRFVLQRMIVANRLVLATKTSGTFKAATMNYAATQEMLTMAISAGSVSLAINGVTYSRTTLGEGFYCSSNPLPTPDDRRNLIYAVSFVLTTPADLQGSTCVTAPCAGGALRCALWPLLVLGGVAVLLRGVRA